MQERDRKRGEGDVRGPTRGDFTDWDNPEDEYEFEEESEDAPEGYYDEELDEEYELTPDDPDYDLSEGASYSDWEDRGRRPLVPQWAIVLFSALLILALLLPLLIRFN